MRPVSTGKTVLMGIAVGFLFFISVFKHEVLTGHAPAILWGLALGVFSVIFYDRIVKKGKGGV